MHEPRAATGARARVVSAILDDQLGRGLRCGIELSPGGTSSHFSDWLRAAPTLHRLDASALVSFVCRGNLAAALCWTRRRGAAEGGRDLAPSRS